MIVAVTVRRSDVVPAPRPPPPRPRRPPPPPHPTTQSFCSAFAFGDARADALRDRRSANGSSLHLALKYVSPAFASPTSRVWRRRLALRRGTLIPCGRQRRCGCIRRSRCTSGSGNGSAGMPRSARAPCTIGRISSPCWSREHDLRAKQVRSARDTAAKIDAVATAAVGQEERLAALDQFRITWRPLLGRESSHPAPTLSAPSTAGRRWRLRRASRRCLGRRCLLRWALRRNMARNYGDSGQRSGQEPSHHVHHHLPPSLKLRRDRLRRSLALLKQKLRSSPKSYPRACPDVHQSGTSGAAVDGRGRTQINLRHTRTQKNTDSSHRKTQKNTDQSAPQKNTEEHRSIRATEKHRRTQIIRATGKHRRTQYGGAKEFVRCSS